MRAILYHVYGPPRDVLELDEIETPVAGDSEVLVRVHAASINPGDWDLLAGQPYILRPSVGFRAPKNGILGLAVAGTVEAVGNNATEFQPGDEVYAGVGRGGFAEYLAVPEAKAAPMPANLTYEQAAAVPVAAVTALQGLRDVGRVQPGQRVLINGASGGVGDVRRADREVLRRRGDRRVWPRKRGTGSVDRRRSRDRLHHGRLHHQWPGVRPHFRQRGEPFVAGLPTGPRPAGILIPNSNKGPGRWVGGYLRRAARALATSPSSSARSSARSLRPRPARTSSP